jgi:hypothetical protein
MGQRAYQHMYCQFYNRLPTTMKASLYAFYGLKNSKALRMMLQASHFSNSE